MATTVETPSDAPSPSGQDRQRQMRQTLLFGVLGFIVLVFLLLVAFGGSEAPVVVRPDMPSLTDTGLQIAKQELKKAGWSDVVAYDASGRDRSMRDERDWRVCFQTPASGKSVQDKTDKPPLVIDGQDERDVNEVWIGAVRINENCSVLKGHDYGIVPRVYALNSSDAGRGTNLIPNLANRGGEVGYTAHMARLAFGEDASIRVRQVAGPEDDGKVKEGLISEFTGKLKEELTGKDVLKSDDAHEIGSGWDNWRICEMTPTYSVPVGATLGTAWNGLVVNLNVVPYGTACP